MSESRDSGIWAFAGVVALVATSALFVASLVGDKCHGLHAEILVLTAEVRDLKAAKCQCKPTPTVAACKCPDHTAEIGAIKTEIDVRCGGLWDLITQLTEDVAKLKPCGCGPVKECSCEPSKPCACSDKPACECKPQQKTQLPVHRVLKRCK